MSKRQIELATNEIYHIVIRGVADLPIFLNKEDYYRAIFSLYEFNTSEPIEIRVKREQRYKNNQKQFSDNRKLLVEIFAFCFMPNHIHLLVKQLIDDGIVKFMRKFGAGYVGCFNKKYDRKGHLFQGRFKAVHIKTNEQLQVVFNYIHTNPISLREPKWKEGIIRNFDEIIKFLENYKWSSYSDYLGKNNFPSLTQRDFLLKIMGEEKGCKDSILDWIKHKKDIWGDINIE